MQSSFNIADILVLAVLALSMFFSYKKGLIQTLFGLISIILALFLTKCFYPFVSTFIRGTWVFDKIKISVIEGIGLSNIIDETTLKAQTDLINGLNLPDVFKQSLLENNNNEIYNMLNVTSIEEYIGGYISNIAINIISVIVVFLLVYILMKFILKALDIVSHLPIINTANKLGGMAVGFIKGTIIIWILFVFLSLFFTKPEFKNIYESIFNSVIAVKFYETNILMKMILKIFS